MALKIKKQMPTGAEPEYWRIKNIVSDTDSFTTVYMFGYLSSQARDEGKTNIEQLSFSVPIDVKTYQNKFIDKCYDELKNLEFFEEAFDV